MLRVVTRGGLQVERSLSPEEEAALRAVAAAGGDAAARELALNVIGSARESERWIECDCRDESGLRPLLFPWRLPDEGGYTWHVASGAGRLEHDPQCVFAREERRRRNQERWDKAARTRPSGLFTAVGAPPGGGRLEAPGGGRSEMPAGGRRVPVLSKLLLLLMSKASLHVFHGRQEERPPGEWLDGALRAATSGLEIAPSRPLEGLFWTERRRWDSTQVHATVRAAADGWPEGSGPQGFLCFLAGHVEARHLPATKKCQAIPVESGIQVPAIGGEVVPGPYIFLGVVGLKRGKRGYHCLRGYAQPIVAATCPVPVEAAYERRVFGTLSTTLRILREEFPEDRLWIEKPVFEIKTALGPCLPDFVIHARRGEDQRSFVIETTDCERPGFLEGKEVTYPRMETLGRVLRIDGTRIADAGLTEEGARITRELQAELRGR